MEVLKASLRTTGRLRLRAGRIAALLALLAAAAAPVVRAQAPDLAQAIKATYLYKFGRFIEWPRYAFQTASEPVKLCIVGNDPFGNLVDRAVRGERIGPHPIRVLRLDTVGPNAPCHILYAAGSPQQSVPEILEAVKGAPVLTITNSVQDPAAKGIIHFVIHQGRVRFEIDDQAASENGIRISSKILNLALSVKPRA